MTKTTGSRDRIVKIALVDDDLVFAKLVREYFEAAGDATYQITHFPLGAAYLAALSQVNTYDVCLLDWRLPDIQGPAVLQQLQRQGNSTPVIFLTGEDHPDRIAEMLLAGADDYVVKPPVYSVLHARILALVRRHLAPRPRPMAEDIGDLTISYRSRQILRKGCAIALTGKETELALYIFARRGQIISRQMLYEAIGVEEYAVDTRRLDVHISHLRTKLMLTAEHGWRLTSVHRLGYRLEYLKEIT